MKLSHAVVGGLVAGLGLGYAYKKGYLARFGLGAGASSDAPAAAIPRTAPSGGTAPIPASQTDGSKWAGSYGSEPTADASSDADPGSQWTGSYGAQS